MVLMGLAGESVLEIPGRKHYRKPLRRGDVALVPAAVDGVRIKALKGGKRTTLRDGSSDITNEDSFVL